MENKGKKRLRLLIPIIGLVVVIAAAVTMYFMFFKQDKNRTYTDPQLIGLSGYQTYEYEADGDEDSDGLTNEEEEKAGTSVFTADTDSDGITDYDEINVTGTDPCKKDTDGDGISDGDELLAGLDPLTKKTDGKTEDSKIEFETTLEKEDCELKLNGNATIYSTYMDRADITGLNQTPGVIGNVYEFYTDEEFQSAEVTFYYDQYEMIKNDIEISDLSICQFNDAGEFITVESVVDEENNSVTATLEHFSKYALCNMGAININATPQAFLLIDNSGSMYPVELCESSDENDVNFKRLDMARQLIEMSAGDIEFGLAKFTATFNLLCDLGSSDDALKSSLESIRTEEEDFNGTYIETSLVKSIEQFEENDYNHRNFIVMITDGYSTEGMGLFSFKIYDEEDIIEKALKKNVSLIIIGLGNNVDSDSLMTMAAGTDGMYINANTADALDQVYEKIMAAINYNLDDSDGDGEYDRVLLADSGFNATTNGFPYDNYRIIDQNGKYIDGQCYGLAALSQLYYMRQLPITMDASEEYGTGLFGLSDKYQSGEYNAAGSFFIKRQNDNFIVNTQPLSSYTNVIIEDYDNIMDIPVKERYTNEDGYLKFTDEVMEIINNNNALVVEETSISETAYEDWTYTKYDSLYINLYNVDTDAFTEEQLQAFRDLYMINRLFLTQLEDGTEKFEINNAKYSGNAQEEAMDRVISMVESGTPVIISACNHSINLTRIYRDLDNPNEYTLVVYNNNYAGEEYELTVTRRESHLALDATELTNDYIYTVYDKDGTFSGVPGEEIDMDISDISWITEE